MKIAIEPTTTWAVTDNGTVARVWQGAAEDGTRVHAIVVNVAVEETPGSEAIHARLRDELVEVHGPFKLELQRRGIHLVQEE